MTANPYCILYALAVLSTAAFAGEPFSLAATPAARPGSLDFTKAFSAAEVKYINSSDLDFKNSHGSLDAHAFQVSAFLSAPIRLSGDWQFIPHFAYEAMLLDTDGAIPGALVGDQDLHEIELSLFFVRMSDRSPWLYGAWVNPAIATDFQSLSGDDFFLDIAGGVGYRVNDRLIIGAGLAALNLTGDTSVYPGPGFFWQPDDLTTVVLYGPNFRAIRELDAKWRVGVEVSPNGGIWNTSTAMGSLNLDYTNFRAGLTASYNLAGDLWLNFGAGATFGGTLNLTTTDGSKITQNQLDDLESGLYGFVGLNLKAW